MPRKYILKPQNFKETSTFFLNLLSNFDFKETYGKRI
jgi:RNAse (barnase) inhibitor barstar